MKRNLLINGGFALALAILTIIGLLNYMNIKKMNEEERWEHHTYAVTREFDELLSALQDVETGELGFVITGKEEFLKPYHAARDHIDLRLAHIRALAAEDPRHENYVRRLEPLIKEKLATAEAMIELRRAAGFQAAYHLVVAEQARDLMKEIRRRVTESREEEEHFLTELNDVEHVRIRKALLALIAGSAVSFSLLVMVFLLLKREIARRNVVEEELRTHRDNLEELVQKRTILLEQAKYEAEIGNRTKSEFLTNMSHEMRTPLTGVLGIIDMLLTNDLTEEDQRHFLNMAKTSADTLKQLINDILELSMIEAGKICFIMQSFDIRACIRFAADMFKMEADRKGLGFFPEIDEGVPERVVGDEVRLRQVLVSLIGNAVKFTEQGKIFISVRLEQDVLRFVVRDTGIGIPADYLNTIFDNFTQADVSLTRKHGGAGLGLALTKQIIENMGGKIRVESRPGEGSEFCFTIPFVKAAP